MSTTKPNLKREKPLKVPMNDVEREEVRKFCAGLGFRHVAPFVRDLTLAHVRAMTNRTVEKPKSEWPRHGPRHGHAQRFPGRAAAAAGGFRRLHL